ncbi:MAG: hypothetical protein AAFR35_03260 [Pseudomonadota bacterium]
MIRPLAFVTFVAASATGAVANEFGPAMTSFYENSISSFTDAPELIEAIRAGNIVSAGYSQADIDGLDQTWRAEVGTGSSPTIERVLQNPASDYLRDIVANAGGAITEVFVMDARGLNVAASDVTSDYWQGDEAKFIETFPAGPGAVHFGEVEFDESTQTYQGQISVAVTDPGTNEVIGALTVGVNADALF